MGKCEKCVFINRIALNFVKILRENAHFFITNIVFTAVCGWFQSRTSQPFFPFLFIKVREEASFVYVEGVVVRVFGGCNVCGAVVALYGAAY